MNTSPRHVRDLQTDLVYMRKSAGFTPGRIAAAGTLRFVLGGEGEPFERLRERFVSAINSLHDEESAILMAAYGLVAPYEGMAKTGDRRKAFGITIGKSADTVENRENSAIKHLAMQLLTGWYPASPLGMRAPELHNGVVNESVALQMVINDGKWQETREEYRFMAAFDEADFIHISTSTPVVVEPLGGFTVKSEPVGSGYSNRFFSPQPMRRGETYTLAFRTMPTAEDRNTRVLETSRGFHERTLTASFKVIFLGEQPQSVWPFTGMTYFERPGLPEQNIGLQSKGNHYWVTYRDLYGGLFSGVAWEWQEN